MQKRPALALAVAILGVLGIAAHAGATTTTPTNIPDELRDKAASTGARNLLVRVDEALNALSLTYYRTDSTQVWDALRGIYKVDCTGYVNRAVEDAVPVAYDELRAARNAKRPVSEDYYYFFKSIAIGGSKGRWRRPAKVSYLKPGDVLTWRYKEAQASGSTGHTMVVVSVAERDTRWSNVWKVRVTDSARSGHSNDNRGSDGSGVGAGYMLVKASSEGQPIAYAWSLQGYFKDNVYLALGRPRY